MPCANVSRTPAKVKLDFGGEMSICVGQVCLSYDNFLYGASTDQGISIFFVRAGCFFKTLIFRVLSRFFISDETDSKRILDTRERFCEI